MKNGRKYLIWWAAQSIRLLAATLRVTVVDHAGIVRAKNRAPAILAFWHNQTLMMQVFNERYLPGYTAYVLISSSRDGQWMADMAAQFGIKAIRGSSSKRGASAALAALEAAKEDRSDLVITPDGPRGPIYQIQPGLLYFASVTGRPIIGVSYEMDWKICLSSWDHFHIPLPFSRCRLVFSQPLSIPADASKEELSALTVEVAPLLGNVKT